jgi:hypothetical protein
MLAHTVFDREFQGLSKSLFRFDLAIRLCWKISKIKGGPIILGYPIYLCSGGLDNRTLVGCLITHWGLSFGHVPDSKARGQLGIFPRQ